MWLVSCASSISVSVHIKVKITQSIYTKIVALAVSQFWTGSCYNEIGGIIVLKQQIADVKHFTGKEKY